MTEPTDAELDAVIAEYRTRIYPQDMHPRFERAIMRAAIAKWGPKPIRYDQLPTLFTVFAKCDEYEGEAPLAQYSATSEYGVLDRVMGDARNAGYTGHAKDRMTELGWRIVPVYAKLQPVAREPLTDTQPQAGACEWKHDDDDGFWESACGEAWQFNDGGPADNNVRFCQGCGKPVLITPKEGGQHGTE